MVQGLKTQYEAPTHTDQYGVTRNRLGRVQNPSQVYANNGVPQQGQYAISQADGVRGYSDKPVDLGNSGWWNDHDTSTVDNYNKAVAAINKSGRIYEGEGFNGPSYAQTIGWFDGNPENKSYRGDYMSGNSSYANAFNDYLSGNRGYGSLNSGWDNFANNAAGAFSKAINRGTEGLMDNWSNQYMNMDFDSLVDRKNEEQYNDAKGKLDRDLARGYLNNAGYKMALDELNANKSHNRNLLGMESTALQDKWNTDARQLIADNTPTGDWISNYNNIINNTWDWSDASKALDNYGQGVNENYFLGGLNSNSYDPDTYRAYGAVNQGLYNPYQSAGVGRKRKLFGGIGEF